jgi:2,6-dihydroxypyridine 3-monooxygenase
VHDYQGARAIVVGGSIGGLISALLLRRLGFDVDVFERTPSHLENRGGGIVLQPTTMKWFDGHSARRIEDLSVTSQYLRYLGPDDDVLYEGSFEWRSTSWGTVYRALLADFGDAHYHLGRACVGFSQDDDEVEVRFVTGRAETADLVVFADGIASTGRRLLYPTVQPKYSGYVGWRGTVREDRIGRRARALLADAVTYSVAPDTHAVMYTIPGMDGELAHGKRLLNYVWYRNVAGGAELRELTTDTKGFENTVSLHPGAVQQRFIDEMRAAAAAHLAPAVAEVIVGTEHPFLQVVSDVGVPGMVDRRVAVIGDAAFAVRPHPAAGSAKAAADAWALYEQLLAHRGEIVAALKAWEPGQLELGTELLNRAVAMGTRSQVTNTWIPGDPDLLPGLYGPGR